MVFCSAEPASLSDAALQSLCKMRTVHHFMRLHKILELPQVPPSGSNPNLPVAGCSESLRQLCAQMSRDPSTYPPIALPAVPSFRVCCDRVGTHLFRSVDVERSVGEVIHEATGVRGCMSAPHTIIRITILGRHVIIGTQLHGLLDGHTYAPSLLPARASHPTPQPLQPKPQFRPIQAPSRRVHPRRFPQAQRRCRNDHDERHAGGAVPHRPLRWQRHHSPRGSHDVRVHSPSHPRVVTPCACFPAAALSG